MEKIKIIEGKQEIEYDLLFTLTDEQKNKQFIVYTDLNDPNLDIYAAEYNEEKKEINYIEDKNVQKMVAQIVETIKKKNIN